MSLNVTDLYPSRWLSPDDITRPVVVTISAVSVEEVREPRGNGTTRKLCLAFARATKRMLLNKTQALAIAELYGADAEAWPGNAVQLLPARSPNGRPTIEVRRPPEHAPATREPSQAPAQKPAPEPLPPKTDPLWDEMERGRP